MPSAFTGDGRRVVIVGAGHGGVAVATLLRRHGFDGQVSVFGDEVHHPYHRPPLSKMFGSASMEQPLLSLDAAVLAGIDLRLGTRVESIDAAGQEIVLADGSHEPYDALVLATGARPRDLPCPGGDLPGVVQIRSLDDGRVVQDAVRPGARIVLIGGGWLGLEIAAGAIALGAEVTVVERESRLLKRAGSAELAEQLARWHGARGVRVFTDTGVTSIEAGDDGRAAQVLLDSGDTVACDLVIVGIGAAPRTELALPAGLDCAQAITTDECGRTSDHHVFALGDVAQPPRGPRLESIPSTNEQAAHIVAAILGTSGPTREVPWFWSDQGPLKVQIAGLIGTDSRRALHTSSDDSFVVIHTDDTGMLRALEAVGSPRAFMAARRMLAEGVRVDVQYPPDELLPGASQTAVESPPAAPAPAAPAAPIPSASGPVTANFVDADGTVATATVPEGKSLMEGAVSVGVPWVLAECGGGCSCGTCGVIIRSPWKELLDVPMPEEQDLLEFSETPGPDLRLSCQILMQQHLEGLVASAP